MSYYKTGGKVSWQGYWQEMLGYDTNNTRNQCKTKGGALSSSKASTQKNKWFTKWKAMYKIGEYFENCTSDIDWYTKDISNPYYSIAKKVLNECSYWIHICPKKTGQQVLEKGIDVTKHHEMQIKIPPHTY